MLFYKLSLFLFGLTSLFVLPSIGKFILGHFFLLLSIYFGIIVLLKKPVKFSNDDLLILSITILYSSATLIGSIYSDNISGAITTFIFLIVFFTIFISYKLDQLIIFIKGFILSAVVTALFSLIDAYQFYFINQKPLLSFLPTYLLGKASEHTIENFTYIPLLDLIAYRAAGLSWDPGLSITGIVIAYVILDNFYFFNEKLRKIFKFLFIVAILLSVSKTSIIAMIFYFLVKLFIKYYSLKVLHILPALVFIGFLYIGLVFEYNDAYSQGNIRHLKYLSSLFYYFYQDLIGIIFGYGYTGVGVFFNHYVEWLYSVPGFKFEDGLNPESTLTNIFFYGGILGAIFWLFTFIKSYFYGDYRLKLLLLVLIVISFGYAINSIWFNGIYFSIYFLATRRTN